MSSRPIRARRALPGLHFRLSTAVVSLACSLLATACVPSGAGLVTSEDTGTLAPTSTATSSLSSTTLTTVSEVSGSPGQPATSPSMYTVSPTEAEPAAKQLAVDIAYQLTTYAASDDQVERLTALNSSGGLASLLEASEPLTQAGSWSIGEVIYPQLGGLTDERASIMVVTRQTLGAGSETESSLVRTLDIRLVRGDRGWEFDSLASAGGALEGLDDLNAGNEVAGDPRIEMPDSARLDILSGVVSPVLVEVMSDLAEQTPYGVVVLATGHPHNVFETDRVSHHTVGQAVDIYRIGNEPVVDDRGPDSATHAIVEWLYRHPDVLQVGSPWDLDGEGNRRSFTDEVHQDHIHIAVDS